MPQGVALHGACFPHPLEREAMRNRVTTVVPWFLRLLVLGWREGYLAAADPTLNHWDGRGALHERQVHVGVIHAYREGFRARRDELTRRRRSA